MALYFNGRLVSGMGKGDKGDPSTLNKIGASAPLIDLSDPDVGVFGTEDNPIVISEETHITFENYTPVPNYQKVFVLYIKRLVGVDLEDVHWDNIDENDWAYTEKPLLPVGKIQEVWVTTVDGVRFRGTGGDIYDV